MSKPPYDTIAEALAHNHGYVAATALFEQRLHADLDALGYPAGPGYHARLGAREARAHALTRMLDAEITAHQKTRTQLAAQQTSRARDTRPLPGPGVRLGGERPVQMVGDVFWWQTATMTRPVQYTTAGPCVEPSRHRAEVVAVEYPAGTLIWCKDQATLDYVNTIPHPA